MEGWFQADQCGLDIGEVHGKGPETKIMKWWRWERVLKGLVQKKDQSRYVFGLGPPGKKFPEMPYCVCVCVRVCVCVCVRLVTQMCLTLCHPMDCSSPGSSVHGILQARILEWVAISFFRGSSWPRNGTGSPVLKAYPLPSEPPGRPQDTLLRSIQKDQQNYLLSS